jgi:HK97 family phage portal protein
MQSKAVSMEPRRPSLPISQRAKYAIESYLATGRGLQSLGEFIFPTNSFINGSYDLNAGWLSVEPRNYPYQNVNGYNSSIVMACINWISRAFMEAEPTVYRTNEEGDVQALPGHKFLKFWRQPNPYYNASKLLGAGLISYYLDGNAYYFKEKGEGGYGYTRALYYVPHYLITPKAEEGEFISYYEYNVNGKSYRIPPDRILHVRNGLDPYKPISGRKILDPVLSEIYTDEEAAAFVAALVRNTAIPGIVIMPDTEKVKVAAEDAVSLIENFKRKFGGDNRGQPLITNFAAKVFQMGFSPEQLQFKEVRRLPEERVAAQFQIAPVVAGLGAGLDKSTYNNYEQAERHSYQSALIPAWGEFEDEITSQLLPEFTGNPSYGFKFDYTEVRALHESQDSLNARITKLWAVDGITRAELREAVGYAFDPKRDEVFFSDVRTRPGLPAPNPVTPPATPEKKAAYLLKAAETEDNLNQALAMSQEASVKDAILEMEGELDSLFKEIAREAESQAKQDIDRYSPEAESARITQEVFKLLSVTLLLRGIWGGMGKSIEEVTVDTVSLRLAIAEGEVWGQDASNEVKSILLLMSQSYEDALTEQTRQAILQAIKGAESGESVASIARRIKGLVSGKEMYPGVYKEGYDAAKAAGASEEQAQRAGENRASRYRAKLIAETETRTYQNQVTLESYAKGGVQKVKVTDGDGCGWREHNDIDKAHNTIRLLGDARKFVLAHPNCKRRFFPIRKG